MASEMLPMAAVGFKICWSTKCQLLQTDVFKWEIEDKSVFWEILENLEMLERGYPLKCLERKLCWYNLSGTFLF